MGRAAWLSVAGSGPGSGALWLPGASSPWGGRWRCPHGSAAAVPACPGGEALGTPIPAALTFRLPRRALCLGWRRQLLPAVLLPVHHGRWRRVFARAAGAGYGLGGGGTVCRGRSLLGCSRTPGLPVESASVTTGVGHQAHWGHWGHGAHWGHQGPPQPAGSLGSPGHPQLTGATRVTKSPSATGATRLTGTHCDLQDHHGVYWATSATGATGVTEATGLIKATRDHFSPQALWVPPGLAGPPQSWSLAPSQQGGWGRGWGQGQGTHRSPTAWRWRRRRSAAGTARPCP